MRDYRKDELGKIRHEQLKMIHVVNGVVMGIASLGLIWTSSSILLHIIG